MQNLNNINNCNDNINGFSLILYALLVSFVLANNLDFDEQQLVGTFLANVGENILAISTYNEYIEIINDKNKVDDNNNNQKEEYKPNTPPPIIK